MGEHYYSKDPQSESHPQTINFQLNGIALNLKSDSGVFSKTEVDFGSKLLIQTFEPPSIEGSILDVGCGYGPIGLSIAKMHPERKVQMIDINERAVRLATENAEMNNVEAEILQSSLYENVKGSFASIVSNPPIRAGKRIVHQLFEGAESLLLDKGTLWVVIQKKQGAPSAVKKLQTLFGDVEVVTRKKGYQIIRASKVDGHF